jgi:hypothetical protein
MFLGGCGLGLGTTALMNYGVKVVGKGLSAGTWEYFGEELWAKHLLMQFFRCILYYVCSESNPSDHRWSFQICEPK